MSHNPYTDALYAVLDALGILVWDENRDYGAKYMAGDLSAHAPGAASAGGAYAAAMRDNVKAHRNHPSIVVWSFCNEVQDG